MSYLMTGYLFYLQGHYVRFETVEWNIILEPVYDSIGSFFGGASIIKKDGLYGTIDDKGRILFTPQFGY